MIGDWIGLGVILLVLAGALVGLARLGRPPERVSAEEFERRVQEARGTTRAGAFAGIHALQKLLNPRAAEAVEAQRDLRAGFYDEKEQGGEGDGGRAEGGGPDAGAET
jgi:hypothetical protein